MKDITIEEKACAKINLALHVIGLRENGYHILDSVVVFTNIYDRLSIKQTRENNLTFTGKFSKTLNVNGNSILQALKLFEERQKFHFYINLEKNLPIGAGLGGGSADAAAIIRFICFPLSD